MKLGLASRGAVRLGPSRVPARKGLEERDGSRKIYSSGFLGKLGKLGSLQSSRRSWKREEVLD